MNGGLRMVDIERTAVDLCFFDGGAGLVEMSGWVIDGGVNNY